MKQLLRVGVLVAAVASFALVGMTSAGAGDFEAGTVIITPNPVEVGGKVTVANADDDDSRCEDEDGEDVVVILWIYSLESDAFEDFFEVVPDSEGNWSIEYTIPNDDAALGTWQVDAQCTFPVEEDAQIATIAPFLYPLADFEVEGASNPVVPPDSGTAPAEEVRTAPRFTG